MDVYSFVTGGASVGIGALILREVSAYLMRHSKCRAILRIDTDGEAAPPTPTPVVPFNV